MNSSEKARNIIESGIITGKLYPRQRLIEKELAAQMGISRGPVREALKQLEVKGLVTKLPTGGVIVSTFTREDIDNTFKVREALETVAIQLVCKNITARSLKKLKRYNENHQKVINKFYKDGPSGDKKFIDPSWSVLFHAELFQSCGNAKLVHYIEELRDIERLVFVSKYFSQSDYRLFYEQHEQIIESVGRRDTVAAEKAVKSHLDTIRSIYIRYL